jgi:hypothetical protein
MHLRVPEGPLLPDPIGGIFHRLGGQSAAVHEAIDLALEETRGFEHAKQILSLDQAPLVLRASTPRTGKR